MCLPSSVHDRPAYSSFLAAAAAVGTDEAHHGVGAGGAPEGERVVGTGRHPRARGEGSHPEGRRTPRAGHLHARHQRGRVDWLTWPFLSSSRPTHPSRKFGGRGYNGGCLFTSFPTALFVGDACVVPDLFQRMPGGGKQMLWCLSWVRGGRVACPRLLVGAVPFLLPCVSRLQRVEGGAGQGGPVTCGAR